MKDMRGIALRARLPRQHVTLETVSRPGGEDNHITESITPLHNIEPVSTKDGFLPVRLGGLLKVFSKAKPYFIGDIPHSLHLKRRLYSYLKHLVCGAILTIMVIEG
jgi:hypothetical protein